KKLRDRWKSHPSFGSLYDELVETLLSQHRQGAGQAWDYVALRNLARSRAAARAILLDPRALNEMTMDLCTFADRAYRHTALAWVSRWCESNGKTLNLYGNGWESHATFAKWAAGPAAPGEDARAIFQVSRINLQLIQPGFIHSRALDGLAAG